LFEADEEDMPNVGEGPGEELATFGIVHCHVFRYKLSGRVGWKCNLLQPNVMGITSLGIQKEVHNTRLSDIGRGD
jgi:hypothetical protein